MSFSINKETIKTMQQEFKSSKEHHIAQRSVSKNGILASSENMDSVVANHPTFSIDLDTGNVTNQKQSGRCWMFAALNTFRHDVLNNHHIKDFELSQNYTFFWDKFEKANYFYHNIIKTSHEDITSRDVAFLLATPQQDGGQWDMLVAIIQKYGIVPKTIMPETSSSSNSRELNTILNKKLRKDALTLRKALDEGASKSDIQNIINQLLQEVYNLLSIALGTPPTEFDYAYYDTDNNYHIKQGLTPQTFFDEFIGVDLDDYISIINAPTKDKPYNKLYTIDMLGTVVGGKEIRHLNLDMKTFKELTIKQLQDGESVWFGCDVGQSSTRDSGIMALDIYSVEETLDIDLTMSKAQRLDYGESLMTHAMVITGVDLVNDIAKKWKVENSWGDKVGSKGYFVMSDDWFEEFTYQVVINKKYLSDELKTIVEKDDVTVLAPWDPMGALA
ncbi:aminopeptidase C [Vagococcus jeotgali]|uniref:aminopeptidase C n=1 Tax=Vagococcus jeotgali TaxID=3109030 RepID=UPI002DD899F6|nr:C1 family peptidase [Vagococcus sp. B2T-5]